MVEPDKSTKLEVAEGAAQIFQLVSDYDAALELLRRIREMEIRIPVVFVSGDLPQSFQEHLDRFQQNADVFLKKSGIESAEFLDHLRSVLERSGVILEKEIQRDDITLAAAEGEAVSPLRLTPQYLASTVSPYLKAIANIQHIVDEIRSQQPRELFINSIKQESPISVSLEGASEAIQLVKETVVPWRRRHAEVMASLAEQEKLAVIEVKKAEILEKRAAARKGREEAAKLSAEAAKQRQEAERIRLENEKLRLELHRAKIQLALDVLAQIAPNLSGAETISYVVRLLPFLDIVVSSDLEIVAAEQRAG